MLATAWIPSSDLAVEHLIPSLSKSLLVQAFLPCSEFSALQSLTAPHRGPPPWTRTLEVWFHTVDPRFWACLREDEERDTSLQTFYESELALDGRWLTEDRKRRLRAALVVLKERRQVRFCSAWALYDARQRYCDRQRRLRPDWAEDDISRSMPASTSTSAPLAPPHSLWPSTRLPLRCPQLDPPPLIYHDTPDFDWEQYEVPFEAAQIAAPLVSTTNTSSWMRSPALEAIGYMSSLLGFKAESYADS